MLFIIPIALSIFLPLTYFLAQEIIWPEFPLTLGQAYHSIRYIAAAPPRWRPAICEKCVNVFSPEYVFQHGLPPANNSMRWEPASKLYRHILQQYPNVSIYLVLASYAVLLAIFCISGHYFIAGQSSTKTRSGMKDLNVFEIINGMKPELPTTVVKNAQEAEVLHPKVSRPSIQTILWRYISSQYMLQINTLKTSLAASKERVLSREKEIESLHEEMKTLKMQLEQQTQGRSKAVQDCQTQRRSHEQELKTYNAKLANFQVQADANQTLLSENKKLFDQLKLNGESEKLLLQKEISKWVVSHYELEQQIANLTAAPATGVPQKAAAPDTTEAEAILSDSLAREQPCSTSTVTDTSTKAAERPNALSASRWATEPSPASAPAPFNQKGTRRERRKREW